MTIRVAIIGAGVMGNAHSNAYERIPNARVTAVVDVNTERAGKIALTRGAHVYTSVAELYDSESIDIADICTPTPTHKDLVIRCADRGMHVIVEKPIAQSIDDARSMIEAVQRNKVFFMVAQVLRFWPEYMYLKQAYDDKRYGNLIQIWFSRTCSAPAREQNGLSTKDLAPFELHIHDLDFIYHMFGKPSAVCSLGLERSSIHASYLKTQYLYEHLPGVIVEAEGGWWQGPIPFSVGFRAVFEEAVLVYNSERLTLYEADAPEPRIVDILDDVQGESKINAKGSEAICSEIAYFLDCVYTSTPPTVITPAEAITTIEILNAELRSAQNGQRVDL